MTSTSSPVRSDYYVTGYLANGEVRTIRSQDSESIGATAGYWATRSWVEAVETNVPTWSPADRF